MSSFLALTAGAMATQAETPQMDRPAARQAPREGDMLRRRESHIRMMAEVNRKTEMMIMASEPVLMSPAKEYLQPMTTMPVLVRVVEKRRPSRKTACTPTVLQMTMPRMMATMKSLRLRDFMKGCRAMRRGVMNHEKTATPVSRRIPGRAERLFRTKDGSCRSQLAIVLPSLCRYILLQNVKHSCSSQDTMVFVFCMQKK